MYLCPACAEEEKPRTIWRGNIVSHADKIFFLWCEYMQPKFYGKLTTYSKKFS